MDILLYVLYTLISSSFGEEEEEDMQAERITEENKASKGCLKTWPTRDSSHLRVEISDYGSIEVKVRVTLGVLVSVSV